MGIFYYFVPGNPELARQASDYGITPFGDLTLNHFARVGGKGPDGTKGVFFGFAPPGVRPKVGFYPGQQEWQECQGYWIGYYKDDPPIPEHLIRPSNKLISGHFVDGWMIPTARVFPDGTQLPESFILNDSGEWESEIRPEFLCLSKRCERAWNMIVKTDDADMDQVDLIDLAVDAIKINYYVDKNEISHARLLDSQMMRQIIFALVDWHTALSMIKENNEARKKKDQPGTPD